jgi:LysW-gamma-L-lysine carboxypeptidase
MSDQAVQLLTNLLGIYSPSGKEGMISDFLAKEMKKAGFRVKKDSIGNIIGEIGYGKPIILFCGHMDTVAGHIPLRVEKGKIFARGAVDAKGPLAAMVTAAASFAQSQNIKAKIIVASVVEEEATSRGIKHLIKDGISADYAIFGEPSGVGNITIGYKGNIHIRIVCKTKTGHSSTPWLYENAIEKAYELWQKIKKSIPPVVETQKSPFHAVTACLTKIRGGKANSVIPFEGEIHLDVRVPPDFTSAQVFDEIRKVIEEYQVENPKVEVLVSLLDSNEPFEVDKRSPLVKAVASSIRNVLKKPAVLLRKTGTGDMNILGGALNVPIVTYGPGDSHLDHTIDEHIIISEYLASIQVYEKTIYTLAELYKKRKPQQKAN